MHTLLSLASLLLVVLSGALALNTLRGLQDWSRRRDVQFLVLIAPVISLGIGLAGLHHFSGRICLLSVPPWSEAFSMILLAAMTLVALAGLGLGLIRLVLMMRVIARRGTPATPDLQAITARLAKVLGATPPNLLVCSYHRPLALTYGLWRPTILLSTWMLEHLDQRELESVLAHEMGHVARRDYLVLWLATVLRDAFFYLPTSRIAYYQLQQEKELACDDIAVGLTRRPLALASALAKVWHHAVDRPSFSAAQSLSGAGEAIEGRITRLLAGPESPLNVLQTSSVALRLGASALLILLMIEVINVGVVLIPGDCHPATILWKLF
jgi:Zn-dependent protease with chaperone function